MREMARSMVNGEGKYSSLFNYIILIDQVDDDDFLIYVSTNSSDPSITLSMNIELILKFITTKYSNEISENQSRFYQNHVDIFVLVWQEMKDHIILLLERLNFF